MMHKAWSSIEEVRYDFSKVIRQISRPRATQNHQFWPQLSVSRLLLQIELTNN